MTQHSSSSSSHTSSGSATGSQHQSLASSAVGKSGKSGGTPATNQRTEVTTSSSGGPMMGILQGAVIVPTGAHSTVQEHTDVMKQKMDSHTKSETHVVSGKSGWKLKLHFLNSFDSNNQSQAFPSLL